MLSQICDHTLPFKKLFVTVTMKGRCMLYAFQEQSQLMKVLRHGTQQNIRSSQTWPTCDRWSTACFNCLMTFTSANFRHLVTLGSAIVSFASEFKLDYFTTSLPVNSFVKYCMHSERNIHIIPLHFLLGLNH